MLNVYFVRVGGYITCVCGRACMYACVCSRVHFCNKRQWSLFVDDNGGDIVVHELGSTCTTIFYCLIYCNPFAMSTTCDPFCVALY